MNDYLFEQTEQGAVLTKVVTSPTHAVIPDMVNGCPVYAIGRYAFEGQDQLKSVQFPAAIHEIRSHAFYNCTNLEQLIMARGIDSVADGAFKNCRSLRQISMYGMDYVDQLLSDSALAITVSMQFENEQTAVLLFPEYDYTYVETVQPRGFQMITYGSGSLYRMCFYRSQIDFSQYDTVFSRAVQNDTSEVMITIALLRLQYPYQLRETAQKQYIDYLTEHIREAAELVISAGSSAQLELLLRYEMLDEKTTLELVELSAQRDLPEAVSLLMDYRLARFSCRHTRFVL